MSAPAPRRRGAKGARVGPSHATTALPALSLVFPFRDDDGTRSAVKDWVVERWAYHFPEAEIVVQPDDGGVPFSKNLAIDLGIARASGEIIAVLDADVWFEPDASREAATLIASGEARWVIPGKMVRLTEAATATLMAQPPADPLEEPARDDIAKVHKVWGGLFMFPRAAYEAIGGYDPRFRGYGAEDVAAVAAMDTLWGPHTRSRARLYHLHHPQPRNSEGELTWVGQSHRNTDLRDRYVAARGSPELMRVLADEVRALRAKGTD